MLAGMDNIKLEIRSGGVNKPTVNMIAPIPIKVVLNKRLATLGFFL